MTKSQLPCYNGMTETTEPKGRNVMPRKKEHDLEFNKRPEGVAYRNQYRKEHYSQTIVLFDKEFRDKIDERAAAEGLSRTKLIVKALAAYLENAGE